MKRSEIHITPAKKKKTGEDLSTVSKTVQEEELTKVQLEALNTGNLILLNSPGMRVLKTGLAILLCFIIEYLRQPKSIYDSSLAAIVCLQADAKKSKRAGWARLLGTMIAGIYAIAFLYLIHSILKIELKSLPYYILLSLFTIPLMTLLVRLKLPDAVSISTMVYIIVCVSFSGLSDAAVYVPMRVFNTVVGILVSIFVNWFPPINILGKKYDAERQKAFINLDSIRDRLERLRAEEEAFEIRKEAERRKIEEHFAEELEEWRHKNRY